MSATNRGSVRVDRDFYPTPTYTVRSLLDHMDLTKVNSFLEPCRGEDSIFKQVNVKEKYWAELSLGVDYLTTVFNKVDLIITNPPFTLAKEFLKKSLAESDCVCYLLRINYLGSKIRKPFWKEIGTPNKLLVLSKRPSFIKGKTDATEYAWFCWDKSDIINLENGIHIL